MTSGSRDSGDHPAPDDARSLLLARELDTTEAARILGGFGFAEPERADAALQRMAAGIDERLALAELLPELLRDLSAAGSPDRGLANLERYLNAAGGRLATIRALAADAPARERLAVLCSQSQSFADVLVREPRLLEWLGTQQAQPVAGELERELRDELDPLQDDARKLAALHRFKRRQLLACGYRDHVLGRPLPVIAGELSHIADALIEAALGLATTKGRARFRDLPPGRLPIAVVALGKLGGGELNYSSDIDLVLVHDERFECPSASAREVFDRLGRELVHVLSAFGAEGALYRVDLRLRPEGAQGALSRGIAAYVRYYESYGRTWERQALLKARPVAGDLEIGRRFLAAIEPFVYRRYLEVGAIGEIKALKRRIETRGAAQPTRDIKEGPGGIRDIEFAVQFLQLLHGGETPSVRDASTLGAIRRLDEAHALSTDEARGLAEAYVFLRTVEHRLQVLHALQTHVLPAGEAAELDLAHRMGFRGAGARERLLGELDRHGAAARGVLERVLHALFPEARGGAAGEAAELILDPSPPRDKVDRVLGAFRIRDAERAMGDLRRLATEQSRFLRSSPRTRTYVASLLPALLRSLAEQPDPDEALGRFERATATLGGKAVFYQLLAEHPDTLDLFARVAGQSTFLIQLLTRNPGAIDELVDLLLTAEPVGVERVLARVAAAREHDPDARLRSIWVTTTLLIGFRDLGGRWNVTNVLEALSALAEAILRTALSPEAPLALLALGKLGGCELGYASDLDLVVLHDADPDRAGREAQALVRRMEALGLYAMDLRLRPEGRASPLATSWRALEDYYVSGRAAVWERLAATKLRPVASGGGEPVAARFAGLVDALYATTPQDRLVADTLAMRRRLEEAALGPFDIKRTPGGLIDLEFVTAFLKLRCRGEPYEIREPGVVPALHALARAGKIHRSAYVDLLTAYQLYRKIEGRLRVSEGRPLSAVPEDGAQRRSLAQALGYVDTRRRAAEAALLEELAFHQRAVRARFDEIVRE